MADVSKKWKTDNIVLYDLVGWTFEHRRVSSLSSDR